MLLRLLELNAIMKLSFRMLQINFADDGLPKVWN